MIEVPTEHNPAKVQSQMEDILTANPDAGSIAGVWVAYDQLGTGAYQAIMNAGRNEIKMASCDGDKISYQMQRIARWLQSAARMSRRLGLLALKC